MEAEPHTSALPKREAKLDGFERRNTLNREGWDEGQGKLDGRERGDMDGKDGAGLTEARVAALSFFLLAASRSPGGARFLLPRPAASP